MGETPNLVEEIAQRHEAVMHHLRESHEHLTTLLAQLHNSREQTKREELLSRLCMQINNTIVDRQKLIYPGVDSNNGLLDELAALQEHAQQLVAKLHALQPGESRTMDTVFALDGYIHRLLDAERRLFLNPDPDADMQAVGAHFDQQQQDLQQRDKVVEKSSKDSFPASDPPASQQFDIPENSLAR